jgi:hypothetical protein
MSTPPTCPPPPPPPPAPPAPPGAPGAPTYYAPAPPPKKSSAVPIVVILIVAIFGGIFVIGIIAAIAIPGLLRARMSGNEAAAIGTMRTMVSAQTAWSATHDGRYVQASCLSAPATCGDAQASSFLTPEIASLQPRGGYDFGLVLRPGADDAAADDGTADGASAAATEGAPGVSPPGAPSDAEVRKQLEQFSTPATGAEPAPATPMPQLGPAAPAVPADLGGFVYWASPSNPGVTGSRRFCVDETGVILVYDLDAMWTPPSDDQPRCPDTGRPLQ